ncbi:hypothetical protein CHLNCDRAFT_137579 [Chlorella variabilis]|uniref:F5/8 type C domain-containing protein n=1 Tax=Chlorella variabilis TaxID=554065 RepID=E1Z408_CHLVA|nr:hypothetical protein CHLNCDRAFT_137579 [Chlorella variabilis]EFN59269.1 hypothetical protein CHLNCDRAFT_137579 [Chlorella variabilis]|eukprot:XP_005851371.1 hypothetical protein CHLNCDRAFT_137579 [Chlorella variabilis]
MARDGNASTYSATRPQAWPWWVVDLQQPRSVTAVKVRLRKDARFKLAWMHDLEARVGSTPPSLRTAAAASAGGSPHTLNARCALLPGQAGTALGQLLRLQCARPLRGRYITLQIRSKPGVSTDVLQLAEVTVEAAF